MATRAQVVAARLYGVGGAIAFVASLALGVVLDARVRRIGSDAPALAVDPAALLANLTLFSAFALHHSVLARPAVKDWVARWVSPALERTTYVWLASALFAVVCLGWAPMPALIYRVDGAWAWAMLAARLAGVVLTIEAGARIDALELSGLRQAWTFGSPTVDEAEPPGPLIARGSYRLVRHPIYLGWLLMVWAVPVATVGWIVFAAISSAYLCAAIPFEERALRARFGDAYGRYASAVRWRVVPGLY